MWFTYLPLCFHSSYPICFKMGDKIKQNLNTCNCYWINARWKNQSFYVGTNSKAHIGVLRVRYPPQKITCEHILREKFGTKQAVDRLAIAKGSVARVRAERSAAKQSDRQSIEFQGAPQLPQCASLIT